jgi:hypothetical protein
LYYCCQMYSTHYKFIPLVLRPSHEFQSLWANDQLHNCRSFWNNTFTIKQQGKCVRSILKPIHQENLQYPAQNKLKVLYINGETTNFWGKTSKKSLILKWNHQENIKTEVKAPWNIIIGVNPSSNNWYWDVTVHKRNITEAKPPRKSQYWVWNTKKSSILRSNHQNIEKSISRSTEQEMIDIELKPLKKHDESKSANKIFKPKLETITKSFLSTWNYQLLRKNHEEFFKTDVKAPQILILEVNPSSNNRHWDVTIN